MTIRRFVRLATALRRIPNCDLFIKLLIPSCTANFVNTKQLGFQWIEQVRLLRDLYENDYSLVLRVFVRDLLPQIIIFSKRKYSIASIHLRERRFSTRTNGHPVLIRRSRTHARLFQYLPAKNVARKSSFPLPV